MASVVADLLKDTYLDLSLTLVGVWLLLWGWLGLRLVRRAGGWPTTPGRILTSDITTVDRLGRDSFLPRLRYRYTVDGTEYQGSRLSFRIYTYPHRAILAAYHYPAGDLVTVHYNPAAPDRSVLDLDVGPRPWVHITLGAALCVIGGGGLLWRAAV